MEASALVEAVKNGEPQAFNQLVHRDTDRGSLPWRCI